MAHFKICIYFNKIYIFKFMYDLIFIYKIYIIYTYSEMITTIKANEHISSHCYPFFFFNKNT